ncbi:MAG TPA: DUF2231 domain-containing protein [Stenomitos sp.]
MKSSVVVAKHPLHPMLIPFPIGAFVFALIGDLAYLGTANTFWYAFATWSIGIGVITGLLAAVPGLIDFLTVVPGEARRTASTHMILNVSIVAVFAINLALRAFSTATTGANHWLTLALTIIADAALVYSGWLGGQLVYHYRIGIEERGQREEARLRVTMSPEEARREQRR